jgi:hypothetical protein
VSPAQRQHLVTHHGVIPIMEMLEVSKPAVQHAVLQVVNQVRTRINVCPASFCLSRLPCLFAR